MVGQRGTDPEENKSPPGNALRPEQVTTLPSGTPVADLDLPFSLDSIRILPAGSVPNPPADAEPPKAGLKVERVDLVEGKTEAECQAFGLAIAPGYVPNGWSLTGCSENVITWSDGETTEISYAAGFSREGYYPIGISRRLLAPGEVVDVVNDSQPFALTITEVRGQDVVVRHQAPGAKVNGPFSITLVVNGVVTDIESAGIDIDELLKIAASVVGAAKGVP